MAHLNQAKLDLEKEIRGIADDIWHWANGYLGENRQYALGGKAASARVHEAIAALDLDKISTMEKSVKVCRAIDELRNTEGSSVEILADNADFGGPNNKIRCQGDWTNWWSEHFTGDTLLEALETAVEQKRLAEQPNQVDSALGRAGMWGDNITERFELKGTEGNITYNEKNPAKLKITSADGSVKTFDVFHGDILDFN